MTNLKESQDFRQAAGENTPAKFLARWLIAHRPTEMTLLMALAVVVGLGAGFGAIIFGWLINDFTALAFDEGRQALGFLGKYYVIFLPAIGGLAVGFLVYRFAPEAKGHGVPEVMEAIALRGGRIRPVVVLIKALASSICIGTGGSAGREGPIVQIGSALGSTLGQLLKMSDERIRTLVACGAAGGIAATFNAPVAGAIFAMEVILGDFAIANFSTVVVASVTASIVARAFVGDVPAFAVPDYTLRDPWELLLYVLLGILAGFVGVGLSRLLYLLEDVFEGWNFPEYFKPVAGGLAVGSVGLFAPEVFGVGYDTIETVLHNQVVLNGVLLLLGAKILATALTLGSGGSGGIFAPSLFIGAMLGGTFGDLAHLWLPTITAQRGAYALVGMAAVFAAAARAPMCAVIILFEMTGDYRIILPLMLSAVIATTLAGHLEKESIYTMKLSRRGIHLEQGHDIDVMQSVRISEVMTTEITPVAGSATLRETAQHFQTHRRNTVPVVDHNGALLGMVSVPDLDRALQSEANKELSVAEIATQSLVTVYPEEAMWVALKKMAPRDLGSLPVVDPNNPQRLLGVVRRHDIVKAYSLGTMHRQQLQDRVTRMQVSYGSDARFVDVEITADAAVGIPLATLSLPRACVIVSIRRRDRILIPHGDTVLKLGDKITAFVQAEDEPELKKGLASPAIPTAPST